MVRFSFRKKLPKGKNVFFEAILVGVLQYKIFENLAIDTGQDTLSPMPFLLI